VSQAETHEGGSSQDDAERALCLLFRVAGERYALRALDVYKVVEPGWINRLPRLPTSVVGISQHRGRIVTVVDLAAYFGAGARALEVTSASRILVLDQGQRNLGLFVDAVEQIASVRLPRPRADGAILSVFQHQGAAVNAVALPRLLERLLALGEDTAV
jgi:chemotaxis signal transduction protein